MRAKKSLGQNFLTSKQVVTAMVTATQIQKGDMVLEIGPGKGILTHALLTAGAKVIAVEKDTELVPLLEEVFAAQLATGQLTLVTGDVLRVPLFAQQPFKIVANIPYYITGELLRYFLESDIQPTSMTLLVQKEVAQRIVSRDGKGSVLSLSIQAYGSPHYIKKVPKMLFRPAPKVDSAILHIANISKHFFHMHHISEQAFFRTVKQGFSQKRKKLSSNLKLTESALQYLHLNTNVRAEEIPLATWAELTRIIEKHPSSA